MELQEFSFGNFRSFKEINTLNLASAKLKSKYKQIDENNVYTTNNQEGVSFLKSKAIYGANASGKSNIINALITFIRILNYSVTNDKILDEVDSFCLSTESENEPTFFQIVFWDNNTKYRYGFEINNEQISAEWLYGKPNKKELCYFIRDGDKIIEHDRKNFAEAEIISKLMSNDSLDNLFEQNSLLLSSISRFKFGKISKKVVSCISSITIIPGLGNPLMYAFAGDSLGEDDIKKFMLDFLKKGDIGIEDLKKIEISENEIEGDLKNKTKKILLSFRNKYNEHNQVVKKEAFSFKPYESEGTQKLFELSPYIYITLKKNSVLIIDEFDARFHPLLTQKILELFNSKENKGAQLVVVTHDTNLLSRKLMRKDQIAFVEKDKYGASHLYSLAEFKGVRNDASFEKDYIHGKYGAIPFLGNFENLVD